MQVATPLLKALRAHLYQRQISLDHELPPPPGPFTHTWSAGYGGGGRENFSNQVVNIVFLIPWHL